MNAWENCIDPPVEGRSRKPRRSGLTMILDKGLGLYATRDLIETAAPCVDVVKYSFGTSAFYSLELCREKTRILKDADIFVMPGGTFLEVAVWKKRYPQYLARAAELGFNAVEVSDGTIDMSAGVRADCIRRAVDAGFRVFTEVGKKDPREKIGAALMHEQIGRDLDGGAFKVIVEAREGGKGVGVFDREGRVLEEEMEGILSGIDRPENLLWEAPLKNQQQYLILKWGPDVCLGNIPPGDILALEALRQGLRGDTLKRAYLGDK